MIQHSADDGDFPYSDWTAPYRTPAGRDAMLAAYGERFDLLLGRRTYDIWSGFWPKAPSGPMSEGINAATKFIATHRPESLEWGPFQGLGPDIVEDVRRVKSQGGPSWGFCDDEPRMNTGPSFRSRRRTLCSLSPAMNNQSSDDVATERRRQNGNGDGLLVHIHPKVDDWAASSRL